MFGCARDVCRGCRGCSTPRGVFRRGTWLGLPAEQIEHVSSKGRDGRYWIPLTVHMEGVKQEPIGMLAQQRVGWWRGRVRRCHGWRGFRRRNGRCGWRASRHACSCVLDASICIPVNLLHLSNLRLRPEVPQGVCRVECGALESEQFCQEAITGRSNRPTRCWVRRVCECARWQR